MIGNLANELSYTGYIQACQDIMQGTYNLPEETYEYTTH